MSVCLGSAKVCALRVARLADDCTALPGATNGAVSTAIVQLQATPEYDTGQEFIQKNGCGDICISLRDLDKLKRITLAMTLCTRDLELIEILTGASLITISGEVSGLSRRGVGADDPARVSLELWTRAVDTAGACSSTNNRWWRWVYPSSTFTLGQTTLENGIATVQLAGFSEPNPVWGNGPWNDWPADSFPDPESPEHFVLDSDGPPTAVCGYTTVPSGS